MITDESDKFEAKDIPLVGALERRAGRRLTREGKRAFSCGILGMLVDPPSGPLAYDDPPPVDAPLDTSPWVLVPNAVVERVSEDEVRVRLPERFVSLPAVLEGDVREGMRVSVLVLGDGRVSVRPGKSNL